MHVGIDGGVDFGRESRPIFGAVDYTEENEKKSLLSFST